MNNQMEMNKATVINELGRADAIIVELEGIRRQAPKHYDGLHAIRGKSSFMDFTGPLTNNVRKVVNSGMVTDKEITYRNEYGREVGREYKSYASDMALAANIMDVAAAATTKIFKVDWDAERMKKTKQDYMQIAMCAGCLLLSPLLYRIPLLAGAFSIGGYIGIFAYIIGRNRRNSKRLAANDARFTELNMELHNLAIKEFLPEDVITHRKLTKMINLLMNGQVGDLRQAVMMVRGR